MSEEKKKILIFGQTGSGKSTISEQLTENTQRLFVYDTLNNCRIKGVIVNSFEELLEFWDTVTGKDEREAKTRKFRIIFRPIKFKEDFDQVCELVYLLGNMTFLCEEIDTFLSHNAEALPEYFLHLVQRGRHRDIEMVGITQRPYAIPPILRSQAKEVYVFRQYEQRDVEFFRPILRDRTDEITTLKDFEFLHWTGGKIEKGFTRKPQ